MRYMEEVSDVIDHAGMALSARGGLIDLHCASEVSRAARHSMRLLQTKTTAYRRGTDESCTTFSLLKKHMLD